MKSITKIIILITAVIAISGDSLYVLGNDMNQFGDQVSNTPYSVKRDPRRCDGIIGFLGCITNDRSLLYPINLDDYDVIQPEDTISTNTEIIISKPGSQSERQPAVDKTKGLDDGPNSDVSRLARSSSPIRSMIRNRNRRSSSVPETSSNKNTTVEAPLAHVSKRKPKLSEGQRFAVTLLSIFTMPYLFITPSMDYEDDSQIYYS